jgi:hypothetical protein
MATVTLTLDPQEKAYLEDLLDTDLRETRVEVRRSLEPDVRDELRKREQMIHGLLTRLRGEQLATNIQ